MLLNKYLTFKAEREQLPVFQHRHRVLEALQRHPVVVVAGETGSGKSTQIPQFLLEELLTGGQMAQPCNIVVTQPRRISAMSLACRVTQELGCEDGPASKVIISCTICVTIVCVHCYLFLMTMFCVAVVTVRIPDPNGEPVGRLDSSALLHDWSSTEETPA